ncbi:MAG: ABC transporter substrate-binding protein [Pyrinomonadaceae bacterium]|jgi:ribose transport system substrate-binding protein|nr:ABC transporter substrate-binding protein [Pyrinomonadaceae bacterium]
MNQPNNKWQHRTATILLVVFALGVLMGVSLAGCAAKKPKTVVGFSQMENDSPWRITETNSIKQEAAKRADRFELIVTDAQGQASKQVADVKDLIARGVNAIFLAPREYDALAPALQAAKEVKIPVFLIDRLAAGKAGEDYVTFLGSDFVAQGANAARWLVAETGAKANIVELTGTPGSSVARDRSQGFNEQVKTRPNMKVIASETADFSREKAQQVMADIIKSKGKQFNAIYAHNDQMALGAIEALKAAGMQPGKDALIIAIDGERAALEAIIRGEMNATIESSPRFGPLAFDTLERYLNKIRVPAKITVEDRLYDKNNAKEYVDEAY